jgi:hypothetical protein
MSLIENIQDWLAQKQIATQQAARTKSQMSTTDCLTGKITPEQDQSVQKKLYPLLKTDFRQLVRDVRKFNAE